MQRSTKIAVAGATGRVGRPVVDILESRGYDVVPISRSLGVDVITGEGLDEALTGVETIIDVATGPSPDQQAATEFFTTSTRNLQEAGERAGVRRLVVVSIIGIDEFEGGYNAAKVAQEQAALAGPIPARIVRAAQFHEFVEELMRWGTQGDVSYVWKMRTQLVSARTVAEALVDLATASDLEFEAAETTEVAGPREERLADAARLLAARRGDGLRVEETSDPSDPDSERYANGAALPGPNAKLAGPTFEEWLDATVPARPGLSVGWPDFRIAKGPQRAGDQLDLDVHSVAETAIANEHHDAVADLDHLVDLDVKARPGLEPVEPYLAEAVDAGVCRAGAERHAGTRLDATSVPGSGNSGSQKVDFSAAAPPTRTTDHDGRRFARASRV